MCVLHIIYRFGRGKVAHDFAAYRYHTQICSYILLLLLLLHCTRLARGRVSNGSDCDVSRTLGVVPLSTYRYYHYFNTYTAHSVCVYAKRNTHNAHGLRSSDKLVPPYM